ncbi:hypothetical protein GCM10023205_15750 [Yinghuangia aomiensis]|uniref:Uncharacterized protein n=1 Tax=Yinghuangia aomiensis TaxID=676205 RepID=A0ABP9H2R8_9ACTN
MVNGTASRISAATGRCVVSRRVRHTAARPTSHTMYCGLRTRLVTTNSRTAVSAASYGVASVHLRALTRHSSSHANDSALAIRLSVESRPTYGPRNSIDP